MVCFLIFLAGIYGTVEASPILVFTPTEVLAKRAELSNKTCNFHFQVGSISSQTVSIHSTNETYNQIIIYPSSAGSKDAEFYIAITPKAEKAFKRLGVSDLKKHFTGKEIEIRGRLDCVFMNIYASPTFSMYHIDIIDLNQIRMVKAVKSKQADSSFTLPTWRVSTD